MANDRQSSARSAGALWLWLLAAVVPGCGEPPADTAQIVRPVRYERVSLQGNEEQRTFSGTAQAAVETDLSFRVQGTLMSRPVDVGDEIARGQLVARLDPKDYQVRVQEAEAGLAQARAAARNAQASYERTRDLYENRNASRSDLDAARAAAESAEAGVRAADQQLEAAGLQLSYTSLRAPEECSIAGVYVKENENVNAGQPVVLINCGDCAEVAVAVPETFIARIEDGSEAEVQVDALPGRSYPAVVTEVGVAAVGTTYPVTVRMTGDCPPVRSGMAADVRFTLRRSGLERSITVPPVAVGEDARGRFVFVLQEDAQGRWFARRRAVQVTGIGPDGITVSSGLEEGELIVTAGVSRITDALEVRLQGEPGA